MGLQRYQQKRNFRATPEPEGKVGRRTKKTLMFVIQKHDATRLHYDFRLELDGVLVSWAVPKGIPTTKGDRRLAMHVEDHPISYGDFEGIIPEGNYGAGSVMVWDTGTWEPAEDDPAKALRDGKLKLTLHGKKLEGEWSIVRMRPREKGKDEWLLIKSGQDIKPISARLDDQSVLTRRTMAEIAGERTRTWKSNRAPASVDQPATFKARVAAAAARRKNGPSSPSSRRAAPRPGARQKRRRPTRKKDDDGAAAGGLAAFLKNCPVEAPRFHEPMKARLVNTLPGDEQWLLELKHDGYRALAVKNGSEVELWSRNQKRLNHAFPSIAEAMRRLPVERLVLDGEIVALGEKGHGSFQLLQNRERITDDASLVFYAFDLLNCDGRDTRGLPLESRRELVRRLIVDAGEPLRFSVDLPGTPGDVLAEVKRLGLEGIIAKKHGSLYETGRRSGSWLKLKCVNEQEFVVGGYTEPKGSRDFFGALLVGYYQGDELLFASKVGSGYSQARLREMFNSFKPLQRRTCPFANLPTRRSGRFGQGITAAEMKLCTWLEPKLVAQVRFTEWTSDGGLRHPVFLGLRDDKKAAEVVRETARS
jgi:bifunctional non-homologous end joining protein LigD